VKRGGPVMEGPVEMQVEASGGASGGTEGPVERPVERTSAAAGGGDHLVTVSDKLSFR
jgi:hypothetical protein